MPPRPPDWQLPPGVTPGVWDYVHDVDLAERYDQTLAGSPLLGRDEAWLVAQLPAVPGRLLDLGCGTGRTLVAAARRGWRVVGVDLSAAMLQRAAAKATREGLTIDLVRANLVELDAFADGGFDVVTCMFSTLGLIHPAAARERVVAHVVRLLKPGGRFLWHAHNRWANLWLRATRWWVMRDSVRSWLNRNHEPGNWRMPPHQGLSPLLMHLFTPGEARGLMRRHGLGSVDLRYVNYDPTGVTAPNLFPALRATGFLVSARSL
jgi:ubiquinone/menaquinone biosynthesis C-methylase UbiE